MERAIEVCHDKSFILSEINSNIGKKRQHAQEEEADRPYPDTSTALCILTNIMASEFEDFSEYILQIVWSMNLLYDLLEDRTENAAPTPPGSADVADVVLFGVNVIIPMIDMEMLKIPNLCQQYVKLISNLIEFFPDKLIGLPADLFNNLIASLGFGVAHDIVDVSILALQAVAPLALWAHNQILANNTSKCWSLILLKCSLWFALVNVEFVRPALNKFLEQVVKLLLFDNLDSSVVDAASEALLSLICAERVIEKVDQVWYVYWHVLHTRIRIWLLSIKSFHNNQEKSNRDYCMHSKSWMLLLHVSCVVCYHPVATWLVSRRPFLYFW